jgi:hypothetical protein
LIEVFAGDWSSRFTKFLSSYSTIQPHSERERRERERGREGEREERERERGREGERERGREGEREIMVCKLTSNYSLDCFLQPSSLLLLVILVPKLSFLLDWPPDFPS